MTLLAVRDTATPSASHPPHRGARAGRRRVARRVVAVLAASLLVLGVWAGWLALDALRAASALQAAAVGVATLQQQALRGDTEAAERTLAELQVHAETARARTHGPHWAAAARLPELGATVGAVQTVSGVVDDLADDALPGLVRATALVDPASMTAADGRVDLAPLAEAAPVVVAADGAVQRALAELRSVDGGAVLDRVAQQVERLEGELSDVAATTATAARAVQLLPPMLGADAPREYLLLVQNNAEPRATGGIPGSVVLLRADDGAVEVVDRRAGGSLGNLPAPVLPLTPQEQALFGDDLGADMRDVTFTPDFPRSGELARAIWGQEVGGEVDGVLSVDPGALAHVLGATGDVDLPAGGTLTAQNAVQLLLNTVYLEVEDPAAQDAFFGATADRVFDAVVTGRGGSAATVEALARSAREGRLMVWSAHPHEQALLTGTVLSGELTGTRGDAPVVGVYLNDGTAAKMGYYLQTDVAARVLGCLPGGGQRLAVTVTLTSTAPADAALLPPYLTGGGLVVPAGQVRTNVLLYAPDGGRVESVRQGGADAGVFAQTHDGLAVVGKTVQLAPGQSVQLDYDVVTGRYHTGAPVLRTTPMTAGNVTTEFATGCS